MPVTLKACAYVKCDLGENNERKQKWMTESGMYCCPKHAQYQRRLDKAKLDKQKGEGE